MESLEQIVTGIIENSDFNSLPIEDWENLKFMASYTGYSKTKTVIKKSQLIPS